MIMKKHIMLKEARELHQLCKKNGIKTPDSHAMEYDINLRKKTMTSSYKSYDTNELLNWLNNITEVALMYNGKYYVAQVTEVGYFNKIKLSVRETPQSSLANLLINFIKLTLKNL